MNQRLIFPVLALLLLCALLLKAKALLMGRLTPQMTPMRTFARYGNRQTPQFKAAPR